MTARKHSLNNKEEYLDKPGDYSLRIESAEDHLSRKGNNCVKFGLRVVQGEEAGKLFFAFLPTTKRAISHFKRFAQACGKDESAVDHPEQLVRCYVCATFVEKDWEGQPRLSVGSFFKDRSSPGVEAGLGANSGQEGQGGDYIRIDRFADRATRLPFYDRSLVCAVEIVVQKPRKTTSLLHIGLKIVSGQFTGRCFYVEAPCDSCLSREFFESLDISTSSGIHVAADTFKHRQLLVDVECKCASMMYERILGFRALSAATARTETENAGTNAIPVSPHAFQAFPFSEGTTSVSMEVESEKGTAS